MSMSNPVLVEVYRGDVLESFHRGVICIVGEDDAIVYSQGDVQQLCYPRSALKFFQQIPLLSSGAVEHFQFTQKEIAIMCGSHNGESQHVETVKSILSKIGLTEAALLCGPQMPTLKEDQVKLIKQDLPALRIHNNCSGKHAGFLAYCVYRGWPIDNYIDPKHALHQYILDIVAAFHKYPKEQIQTGIDGCSAPIFAFPVVNQAIAYRQLIAPTAFSADIQKACQMMFDAVNAYPEMIAGEKRYCTDLMRQSKGQLIGKTGADGVYAIAIKPLSYGICIKVDDGKMGPQYNIAQALIEQLSILDQTAINSLRHYVVQENKNFGGLSTGYTKVSASVLLK